MLDSWSKKDALTETDWDVKEQKIERDFLRALGPEATHQITRSEWRTELDKIKVDKLLNLYSRCYLSKRSKYNLRGDFFY